MVLPNPLDNSCKVYSYTFKLHELNETTDRDDRDEYLTILADTVPALITSMKPAVWLL